MEMTKQNLKVILKTIGVIKNPNYETVLESVLKNKNFSGDLDINQLKSIHKKSLDIGEIDFAVELLSDDKNSSGKISADQYILEKRIRSHEMEKLHELFEKVSMHREYIEYKIVRKKFEIDLMDEVNKLLKNGWEPIGGVSYAAAGMTPLGNTGNTFIQAMVKYKN